MVPDLLPLRGPQVSVVSVVTGAGSGIGRALSLLLAAKGLQVLAVGRRQQVGMASAVGFRG